MPRGGAYADCAEQWSPGILSRPPPRRVGGRGATETVWCAGVCGALLRCVRVDPQGWGVAVAALRQEVQGRHPYLVTRASCCGVPFTPTSRKKSRLRQLRALVSSGYYADEVHTCVYSGCAVRLWTAWDGWPAPVLSARTIRGTCSDAVLKRGAVAQPTSTL